MRCPKCGNEVRPEEAFCGQCGTPNTSSAPAGEITNTPSPRSGFISSYPSQNATRPFPASQYNPYRSGVQPSPMLPTNNAGPARRPATGNLPPQPLMPSAHPQQQSGFYQDATEAMNSLPTTGNQGYSQPHFTSPSQVGYPAQHSPQQVPFQNNNYSTPDAAYRQQPLVTGQGYDYGARSRSTPLPRKQRSAAFTVIVTVCLIVTLLAVGGLGAFIFLKGHTRQPIVVLPTQTTNTSASPTPVASSTAATTPTTVPSPTPTVGPTVTVTATAPTPVADAGFVWCGQDCANNGFTTEYPTGWGVGSTPRGNGLLFTPPPPSPISVAFKQPGQTPDSAQNILAGDLQGFANQPGYTPPQGGPTASTIAGETWVSSMATYQLSVTDTTKERVVVYATVHAQKAYIIELQAPDTQFDTVNNQYFVNMIGRFQFQPFPNQ